MAPIAKRILAGALIAASGAFAWGFVGFRGGSFIQTAFIATCGVVITSWFVLPMGGFLGAIMPKIVGRCSAFSSVVRGSILGICSGIIAAMLTTWCAVWPTLSGSATIVDRGAWKDFVVTEFLHFLPTMTAVCALWVAAWAYWWNRKEWHNEDAPQ